MILSTLPTYRLKECCIIPRENLRKNISKIYAEYPIKQFKGEMQTTRKKQKSRRDLRQMANSSNIPANLDKCGELALPFSHCAIKNGKLLQEYPESAAEFLRAHHQGTLLKVRTVRTSRVRKSDPVNLQQQDGLHFGIARLMYPS